MSTKKKIVIAGAAFFLAILASHLMFGQDVCLVCWFKGPVEVVTPAQPE